jgi:hypothetical protein
MGVSKGVSDEGKGGDDAGGDGDGVDVDGESGADEGGRADLRQLLTIKTRHVNMKSTVKLFMLRQY